MHADIKGALIHIDKSWKTFEHRNKPMSKNQVKKVLQYGLSRGYKYTSEFSDEEVDEILSESFLPGSIEHFNAEINYFKKESHKHKWIYIGI